MESQKTITLNHKLWLTLIIIIGLFLRLWHIDFQSLWLDEMYTAHETDPDTSWSQLFTYLNEMNTGGHPPLHYIIVKVFFLLFGQSDAVLRIPSAIAGTLSIWAMFMLARELWNTRIGLIAAAITALNAYNIEYSQEGRDYIFTFLFTILSFFYLIKLLRQRTLINSIIYGILVLLLIYTHYFNFFLIASQVVIISVFFFYVPNNQRWVYVRFFSLSGLIAIVGYIPWLPSMLYLKDVKSFWISTTEDGFISNFFLEYFGYSDMLKPLLIIFVLIFFYKLFTSQYDNKKLTEQPLNFSFVIILLWVLVTSLLPYIRSRLVIPMLISRYTISVMPAYILIITLGIDFINNKTAKNVMFGLFLLMSFIDITVTKQYYSSIKKAQFREMTQFIIENNHENYPIAEEHYYAWPQNYYFKQFKAVPHFIEMTRNNTVDSILPLVGTPKEVEGFWLVAGHVEGPTLSDDRRASLSKSYMNAGTRNFFGGWTELFYLYKNDSTVKFITYRETKPGYAWGEELPVRSNNPTTIAKLTLEKGKYVVTTTAKSADALDTFGNIRVLIDDKPLYNFQTSWVYQFFQTTLDVPETKEMNIQLALTNDYHDPITHKDRNGFVRFIRFKKIE
ncbi:MAG: glycosyltransferase family 39 protein [Bacteroidetes bacterium]|nr:glycosyltransferase family 39 protein [Bacteroidota bacterium]